MSIFLAETEPSSLLHVQIENIIILLPVLFGIIFGSVLWKQIAFPIILSQVVGSDSQCLFPITSPPSPETKFPKFEGALWKCAIKIKM